jgi:nitrate/TMAO reductase-like tetraheme cytochrome c subunit
MEILCKHCHEFFQPSEESLEMIAAEFISSDTINTCPECWDLIELSEFDLSESYSDADQAL